MKLLCPLTTLLAVYLTAATTVVSATDPEGDIIQNSNGAFEYETAAESEGRAFNGVVGAIDWDEYNDTQQDPDDRTIVIIGDEPVEEIVFADLISLREQKRRGRPCGARGSMAGSRGGSGGVGQQGRSACDGRQGALRGRRQEEAAAAAN
jgi:hypothetical protein